MKRSNVVTTMPYIEVFLMAWTTLLVVNISLQEGGQSVYIFATLRPEAKTNGQMQNGLHGNQGSNQSQNFKQVYICTGYSLDRSGCHTVYSIRRAGNQWIQVRYSMCDRGQPEHRFHPWKMLWSIPDTKSETRHSSLPLYHSECAPDSNCDRHLFSIRQVNS